MSEPMTNAADTADCCAWLEERGGELLQGSGFPLHLRDAAQGCESCQAALAGAEALRGRMDAWRQVEAPDDLVDRTLAKLALAAAAQPLAKEEGEGAPPAAAPLPTPTSSPEDMPAPKPARRSTVIEFLVTAPLADAPSADAPPPAGKVLFFRAALQMAAALLLFVGSSLFVAAYYPAVTHALEESERHACQEHLQRLHEAALQYRADYPEGKELIGFELRNTLIRGGYAREEDFVCPSKRGRELGHRSYVGELPAGTAPLTSSRPLFWGRFGNHSTGFNAVRTDGKVQAISEENFARWHRSE